MYQYDLNSLDPNNFINDQEILDTLEYAEKNKNNMELIDSILEKEVIEVSKGQLYSKKTHNIELFEKKLSPLWLFYDKC